MSRCLRSSSRGLRPRLPDGAVVTSCDGHGLLGVQGQGPQLALAVALHQQRRLVSVSHHDLKDLAVLGPGQDPVSLPADAADGQTWDRRTSGGLQQDRDQDQLPVWAPLYPCSTSLRSILVMGLKSTSQSRMQPSRPPVAKPSSQECMLKIPAWSRQGGPGPGSHRDTSPQEGLGLGPTGAPVPRKAWAWDWPSWGLGPTGTPVQPGQGSGGLQDSPRGPPGPS